MRFLMIVLYMNARTGRIGALSAAGLAGVPTTRLAQHDAARKIARQPGQLLVDGHRLIQIGQEIAECRSLRHVSTPAPSTILDG
jgi:hypothetical protein